VNFSLMPDPDGHVGLIQVLDRVTGLVIGTISTTANVLNVQPTANFQVIASEGPKAAAQVQAELTAAQNLYPVYQAVAATVAARRLAESAAANRAGRRLLGERQRGYRRGDGHQGHGGPDALHPDATDSG
jgi:hypothetical protein